MPNEDIDADFPCAAMFVLFPSVAISQVPTQDSTTGVGIAPNAGLAFEISATSGASGENPTGQVTALLLDGSVFFSGQVTCLAVQGNVATLNIDVLQGAPFGRLTFQVTDSGTSDIIDIDITADTREPGDCSPVLEPLFRYFVDSGDLVVVDAPPLPTSKDQCKNGGWKTHGVFKNQGDCVSFVASGP
jgi:hypothetical protein